MYRELDRIGKLFGAQPDRVPKRQMSHDRRHAAGNACKDWECKATSNFRTFPNKANLLETLAPLGILQFRLTSGLAGRDNGTFGIVKSAMWIAYYRPRLQAVDFRPSRTNVTARLSTLCGDAPKGQTRRSSMIPEAKPCAISNP
jgi:hypothetical protein